MISNDDITRALAPLLLRPLRPAERLRLAETFETLARQQHELAAADTAVGHVKRRVQLDSAPRSSKGGRPKGTGARFIRVELRPRGIGAFVHVGRALWQELGEPRRLDPQRVGSRLMLVPTDGDTGYSVTQPPNGMPRFTVGQELLDTLRIEVGRMPAEIRAGMIVVV